MTNNLLVVNKDFPPIFDFAEEGKSVMSYNFGSMLSMRFSNDGNNMSKLVDDILKELDGSKTNQQFLRIKNDCNIDTLYKKMYKPLLKWVSDGKV